MRTGLAGWINPASATHTSLYHHSLATNIRYFEFSSYTTLWCSNFCLCLPSALIYHESAAHKVSSKL